jgi:RNA 2',3'-cyclic 3'-phosphodiesterase
MRLFVAVWPTEKVLRDLSDVMAASTITPELRWVQRRDCHVTLAFLGSVPDDEHDQLTEVLQGIATSGLRCTAVLGPETSLLGPRVLQVPVTGLDDLADAVGRCTAPFNRSKDHARLFVGHLTLARARKGRPIPATATGLAVSSAWPVSEIRLVSSTGGPQGPRYTPTAFVALDD